MRAPDELRRASEGLPRARHHVQPAITHAQGKALGQAGVLQFRHAQGMSGVVIEREPLPI